MYKHLTSIKTFYTVECERNYMDEHNKTATELMSEAPPGANGGVGISGSLQKPANLTDAVGRLEGSVSLLKSAVYGARSTSKEKDAVASTTRFHFAKTKILELSSVIDKISKDIKNI